MNVEEREQNFAVQIIKLWKRPEVRQRFKNIAALWDSFAYKGKSSEESFKDTTTQAHIDAIRKEIDTKIKASSTSREEINTEVKIASAGGAKIKPAPARQTTSDNDASESEFEKLFIAHAARLRAVRVNSQLISACYPELVAELEKSVTEISTSWTDNNLEAFKAALSKTERIYKKTAVIAETKHPLL